MSTDPSLKQIIPYAVVVSGGQVFRYFRQGGGEARLLGLASVGVGGHINPIDGNDPVRAGIDRELDEELVLPAERTVTFVGFQQTVGDHGVEDASLNLDSMPTQDR